MVASIKKQDDEFEKRPVLFRDGSDGEDVVEGDDVIEEEDEDEVNFDGIDEGDEGDEDEESDTEYDEKGRKVMTLKDLMSGQLSDGSDSDFDAGAVADDEDIEIEEDEETGATADNEAIVHAAKRPRTE